MREQLGSARNQPGPLPALLSARPSLQHRPGGPSPLSRGSRAPHRPRAPAPLAERRRALSQSLSVLLLGEPKELHFPGNKEMFLPSVPRGTLLHQDHVSTASIHSRRMLRRLFFRTGKKKILGGFSCSTYSARRANGFGRLGKRRCAC